MDIDSPLDYYEPLYDPEGTLSLLSLDSPHCAVSYPVLDVSEDLLEELINLD